MGMWELRDVGTQRCGSQSDAKMTARRSSGTLIGLGDVGRGNQGRDK